MQAVVIMRATGGLNAYLQVEDMATWKQDEVGNVDFHERLWVVREARDVQIADVREWMLVYECVHDFGSLHRSLRISGSAPQVDPDARTKMREDGLALLLRAGLVLRVRVDK